MVSALFNWTFIMRRPRKVKTRKAVAKRFKVTASGKVLRTRSGKRHLMASKNSKRRRRLGSRALVADGDMDRIALSLPFASVRRKRNNKPAAAVAAPAEAPAAQETE